MDQTQQKPVSIADRHVADARRTFADPLGTTVAGRTAALTVDEVLSEARRRVQLYRSAPRGDNPAKADAVEAFLHWLEAAR